MATLKESRFDFVYDLDIRDYNLWMSGRKLLSLSYTMQQEDVRSGFRSSYILERKCRVNQGGGQRPFGSRSQIAKCVDRLVIKNARPQTKRIMREKGE